MAYIGNTPAESFASFEKQVFTIVNSQTAYTLSHSVVNENDIRLVVNNVVQEPGSGKAYTASGTSLTLSAALVNGTDEMYCVFLGRALQTVNPPNASVGTAQLASEAVTNAKVASTIITGQTAETSIATDDLILLSDTSASGALRKMTRANFVSGVGGANTPAFLATMSAQSVSNNTYTKLAFATEVVDTNSAYDHSSNYRFTVPSGEAGLYYFTAMFQAGGVDDNERAQLVFAKNGTRDVTTMTRNYSPGNDNTIYCTSSSLFNLSATDYIEVEGYQASGNTQTCGYGQFGGFKIIT